MNAEQLDRLDRVRALLAYATEYDHEDCGNEGCSVENPSCREMHAIAALKQLEIAIEPVHEGFHPKRLENDPERIYAEQWKVENQRSPGVNSGFTLLEWILTPEAERGHKSMLPQAVTERDARVAATVIQWLGTNCGRCFMDAAERKIEQARAIRYATHPLWASNLPSHPRDVEIAKCVCSSFAGDRRQPELIRRVAAALAVARKEAVTDALKAASESLAAP